MQIINLIKTQIILRKAFFTYGFISAFVTIVDVLVCRGSELFFNAVIANTMGVISGFIIQYFLTAKHVYNKKNIKTFVIFLLTFFIGLLLANGIVFVSRSYLFNGSDSLLAFLVSKGFSIVFPFFFIYFLRKKLINNTISETDSKSKHNVNQKLVKG